MRRVGGMLHVCIQTHTLLDNDAARVVLQVEQVLCVLGHLRPSSIELWACEVASGLKTLAPLRLLLDVDRKEHDRHVGEASLAQGSECHVRHLLDGVINLTPNDGSYPQCCGVDGYLHPDPTIVQAMGLKGLAAVDRDRPIVAEANECAQQHSRKSRAVSARGPKASFLAEGAVGVVFHVHLRK
jgi:hypothetical protein